ncbi:DUF6702 family protein [Pseudoalteromonas aurantia]|uniref:Orphan protein n=1 Tax=Pseudoalteromonas aurantia 208 TaxID=1314867 RepID=A0ABR9EGW8_9GAMM|nr:DUF6702 family protein [Pseudoalteromonas aurantia]MBE0370245.1 hypothetical protein [Pseudoalteromonas aurantia 208]
MNTKLLIMSLLFVSSSGVAHQLKSAKTTVHINRVNGHVEVLHRYYVHDVEHAAEVLFGTNTDIFTNMEAQKRFADYVSEHVHFKVAGGKRLSLVNLGTHIDGPFFIVYQETQSSGKHAIVSMQNRVLQDIWPEQINMVYFEEKNSIRSLHFDKGDDWLPIIFNEAR